MIMAGERISLTWQDHHSSLIALVETLLGNSWLVDCTLAAEGKYLKAHKVILSACSPYFQLLFNQESEKNPIVILKDVKYEYLQFIIDFIYRGNVELRHTQLSDFLELAKSLRVKGLDTFHVDQSSKSIRNSEPACTGSGEKSQQREELNEMNEESHEEGCEIVDNADVSEDLFDPVPASQQEHDEPEEEINSESTVTIESTYSIALGASGGDSETDVQQGTLPLELPSMLSPQSPSALSDHSVDTVIMVRADDETIEPSTDVKKEDQGNPSSECSQTPLRNGPGSCNENIPQSNNSLLRRSSVNIIDAIKKDSRLNPRVCLNKLVINPATRTNCMASKSQGSDDCRRVSEGNCEESISAGGEASSASRSILSDEHCSKQPTVIDGTILERSSSEHSTISLNFSNSQPSESSTVRIRKRASLMKVRSQRPEKRKTRSMSRFKAYAEED